jgi:hypothetical protein
VRVLGFYRRPGFNTDINGLNAIEEGGGFKRGIKGGKMKVRW